MRSKDRPFRPALTVAAVSAGMAAIVALAGCGTIPTTDDPGTGTSPSSSTGTTGGQQPQTPDPSPTPDPVSFGSNVEAGAKSVQVDTVVQVKASNGSLSRVTMTSVGKDRDGSTLKGSVSGAMSADKASWDASGALDPDTRYTLTMTGKSTAGVAKTSTRTFRTTKLSLDEQTYPTIFPTKGTTVGVGMPVVLTFDIPVKDKAEFEKHLSVTTTPKQVGSWYWISSTEVHYRPKTYWKPGTKVSVDADLNGVNAGGGIYGQESRHTTFTIGRSLITKVNLRSDVAHVYKNHKLVRTIYVSGGKPGWETRSGTKLIMAKNPVVRMTNQMIGADEPYDLQVKWAMRITSSGEFLHAAPWNSAAFGRYNGSHGCVGMSDYDAYWLYNQVLLGDPVETIGSSRDTELGNGWADWNASWKQWQKGSAL